MNPVSRNFLLLVRLLLLPLLLFVSPPPTAFAAVPATEFRGEQTLILERGPHHRREQFIQQIIGHDGEPLVVTNEYTVLGTGMHYLENGAWKESSPELEEFADGFVARHSAHRGVISRQLLQAGVIDALDPDGRRLQATPSLLVFRNRVTGDAIELARIVRTEGQLDSASSVIFPRAFDRLDADVLIKWANHGFECDIVLRESLPDPAKLGLDPELTDFEVLTEFYDSEPTARRATTVPVGQKDRTPIEGQTAVHEQLEFGKFNVEGGDAAFVPAGAGSATSRSGIPVRRTLHSEGARRILIESIPYLEAKEMLKAIPPSGASWEAKPGILPGKMLPPTLPGATEAARTEWATKVVAAVASGSVEPKRIVSTSQARPGMIMDWPAVIPNASSYTFYSGRTYQVSGYVSLGGSGGTVNLNADVVIKYSYGATLAIVGNTHFNMKTDLYRPAVFLSKDDNSLGETVSGSTGNPLDSPAATALYFPTAATVFETATLANGLKLKHFRIRNAAQGIKIAGIALHKISHGQFVDCGAGITAANVLGGFGPPGWLTVANCLFAKCEAAFESLNNAPVTAHFLTFDPKVANQPIVRGPNNTSTLYLWNSIVANTTQMPAGVVYTAQTYDPASAPSWITSTSPFLSAAAGNYYLPLESLGRDSANDNAIALFEQDLARVTVAIPELIPNVTSATVLIPRSGQRANDRASRGYRYPAIDYIAVDTAVSAALSTQGGLAIATAGGIGFNVSAGGSLNFWNSGILSALDNSRPSNIVARFSSIQEQRLTSGAGYGSNPSSSQMVKLSANGFAEFRSTEFLAGLQITGHRTLLNDNQGNGSLKLRDCIAHHSSLSQWATLPNITPSFEAINCYWDNATLNFGEGSSVGDVELWNNLFLDCNTTLTVYSATSNWNIRDNLFGDGTITYYGGLGGACSQNAFKGTISLPGAYNQTLTQLNWVAVDERKWPFFYPLSGNNLALLNTSGGTGSRGAIAAGLYHYTTDATPPATVGGGKRLGSNVNIGLHYPAAKKDSLGLYADQDNDGVADIYEDINGNGSSDVGETAWNPPNGISDTDGDKLTDLEETLYGSNPLAANTDADTDDDWKEAHNMLNPNKGPWEDAKLIDRFRFNSTSWITDGGRTPTVSPPSIQSVDSFEEKAATFPNPSTPVIYDLGSLPVDLAYGTVRFWYLPDSFGSGDTAWRTLLYARGDSAYHWTLELQPSTRKIVMKSTVAANGVLRENFVGKIPCAGTPGQEVFEICLSYTAGSTWLSVNGAVIGSEVILAPPHPQGVGVDLAGVNALNASSTRRLAIGGRITVAGAYDQPALGRIDDIEWYNTAMFNPVPLGRAATPWGATRISADLRRFGGWATSTANGLGIEVNLRRGWEGPVTDTSAYRLQRREWGVTGANAWQDVTLNTRANVIVDFNVTASKWYEYRLPTTSRNFGHSIWGYAGTRPTLTSNPGFAIVVAVDQELLSWEASNGPLHTALTAYVTQLKNTFGEANVIRIDTLKRMQDDPNMDGQLDPKEGPVLMFDETKTENTNYKNDLAANKAAIIGAFQQLINNSVATRIAVLIGHVTVPLSGEGAEDGHVAPIKNSSGLWQTAHGGAWPCDAWYGDFDGVWTDYSNASAGLSSYVDGTPRTDWQARNVVGDGKFDQNTIPQNQLGEIRLEANVGRIDFSKTPGFLTTPDGTGVPGLKNAELRLTAAYLNKATAFRTNPTTSQPISVNSVQALFGSPPQPRMPIDSVWLSLKASSISVSTRQFNGALPGSAWVDLFGNTGMSIWGVQGAFGSYDKIGGTWDADHRSLQIVGQLKYCHSLFSILRGSFLGDWNHEPEDLFPPMPTLPQPLRMTASNLQKAILSQQTGGLVTMYHIGSRTPQGVTQPNVINFARSASGFPLGVLMQDSLELDPMFSCRLLYILGDPTLLSR